MTRQKQELRPNLAVCSSKEPAKLFSVAPALPTIPLLGLETWMFTCAQQIWDSMDRPGISKRNTL
jgi:hypothetical protein